MNMKKTMAAIAAGAVAVSAMATSVSALADKTFTYNLTENVKVKGGHSATLSATVTGASATTNEVKFDLKDSADSIKTVTVRVAPDDTTVDGVAKTYVYSTDNNSANFVPNTILNNSKLDITNITKNLKGTASIVVTVEISTNADKLASANGRYGGTTSIFANDGDTTYTTVSAYTGGSDTFYKVPFTTASSGNINIIQYLQNGNLTATKNYEGGINGNDKYYTNVAAVLNDAVANYEGVTFVFHTAKDGILLTPLAATVNNANTGWAPVDLSSKSFSNFYSAKKGENMGWANQSVDGFNGGYEEALLAVYGDASLLVPVYSSDWYADTSYKSFTDHLYNGNNTIAGLYGNYANEATGFTGFDWGGYNLFQSALIVNESLTMSLSDTEFFDWTEDSVSFDWDAIYSNAMTSNNYATYIQSLKLATSAVWYWDSMDVVLTAGAAEDASSGAGTAGDEDTLDDTDDGDDGDIALDDDGDDDDGDVAGDDDDDDGDVDTSVDNTQAPAQTASNPQTGNASVALAVIPVALAAAAIVAKKRG